MKTETNTEKLRITETPIIKTIIKLEKNGLVFDRAMANDILWEMQKQVEGEMCEALLKDIEVTINNTYGCNKKRIIEEIKQLLKKEGEDK